MKTIKKIVVIYQRAGYNDEHHHSEHTTIAEANKEARWLAKVIRDGQGCPNIKQWHNIRVEKQIFELVDGELELVDSFTPQSGYAASVKGII